MTSDKQLLEQALEALECCMYPQQKQLQIIAAIRARLEQPEQEPVATVIGKYLDRRDVLYTCIDKDLPLLTPLYTTSPTYDQGWKDGYKHGAWANTAAPVQEPVAWQVNGSMVATAVIEGRAAYLIGAAMIGYALAADDKDELL